MTSILVFYDSPAVPGVIITGGSPRDSVGVSVEVFNPQTNNSCRLPDLPGEVRYFHSLCGDLLCGGADSSSTRRPCLKLSPQTGVFTSASVSLVEERADHQCWDVEGEGVLLIGGGYSPRSTELVSPDGSFSSPNFTLPYDTR